MSTLAVEASLVVATFDLLAVSAVTGAIRAADLESGDVLTPSGIIEKPELLPGQGFTYTPAAVFEPRRHIYPSPVYERRRVIQAEPRLVETLVTVSPPARDGSSPDASCGLSISPIEPPWKVLPWMDRYPKRVVYMTEVKIVAGSPDNAAKGVVIDLLI